MSKLSEDANERLWEDWNEGNGKGSDYYNPLPVQITGALTQEQLIAYQIMFRIQEITSLLRNGELRPPERRNRSPSPPPAYDARGQRVNTKEQRYRKSLEEERHRLVEIALRLIPHFVAPDDYKRPVKFQDKYYIPVDQYPGINFVGLLLGPRGNTLRKLQEDSGCKIAIRGRGSVKEGKNTYDLPKGAMNFSDPLHCLVIADSEDNIQHGIKLCESIVIKAVTSPEGQNDLKRGQLRELAELNGILREDNRPCPICGLQGHRKYECPNMETFAQKIICRRCGQPGHVTIDCTAQVPPHTESRYGRYNGGEGSRDNQEWFGRPPRSYPNSSNAATTSYRSRYNRRNEELSTPPIQTQYSTQEEFRQDYGAPPNLPPGFESNSSMPGIPGMSAALEGSLKPVPSEANNPSSTLTAGIETVGSSANLPDGGEIPGLSTVPGLGSPPVGLGCPPGLSTDMSPPISDSPTLPRSGAPPGSEIQSLGGLQGPPGSEIQSLGGLQGPPGSEIQSLGGLQGPPGSEFRPLGGLQGPPGSEVHPLKGLQGPPGSKIGPTGSLLGSPGLETQPSQGANAPPNSTG